MWLAIIIVFVIVYLIFFRPMAKRRTEVTSNGQILGPESTSAPSKEMEKPISVREAFFEDRALMAFGIVGFLIGGFVGYLARPSAFLVGQLSFEHVISRGASLKGMDQMLVPIAQQSFNITLTGAIIGAIAGIVIGYFVGKRQTTQTGA